MCKRILIVDDEAAMRELVSYALQKEKNEVISVKSGEEALEQLENEPFDLLVTDNSMPGGMTGRQLVSRVRRTPGKESMAIIMVSGDGGLTCEECNVDALVRKPFRFPVLKAVADIVCAG